MKPILFSTDMVRAILDGRKTMTRRLSGKGMDIINTNPDEWRLATDFPQGMEYRNTFQYQWETEGKICTVNCPYGQMGDRLWQSGMPPCDGYYYVQSFDKKIYLRRMMKADYPNQDIEQDGLLWGWNEEDDPEAIELADLTLETIRWKRPGDRLWVRETHYRYGRWVIQGKTATGKDMWHFCGLNAEIRYYDNPPDVVQPISYRADAWYKRPSIFLPRVYARLFLEITEDRVERLQEITGKDARAEGIVICVYDMPVNLHAQPYVWRFQDLWDTLNAKHKWDTNPWVWVVSFKVVE